MMKDDDFKLLRGFEDEQTDGQTDKQTDICDCRVAFATENIGLFSNILSKMTLLFSKLSYFLEFS